MCRLCEAAKSGRGLFFLKTFLSEVPSEETITLLMTTQLILEAKRLEAVPVRVRNNLAVGSNSHRSVKSLRA